ncbi:hypothetical protein BDR07DRAFT_1462846 [Suillus spraguei]|nr:hypothetical protein BDR07DRAFT_1462846 [Suillus spraguei]
MSSMQLGEAKQDQQPASERTKQSEPNRINIIDATASCMATTYLRSGSTRQLVPSSPSYIPTFPKPKPGPMPKQTPATASQEPSSSTRYRPLWQFYLADRWFQRNAWIKMRFACCTSSVISGIVMIGALLRNRLMN